MKTIILTVAILASSLFNVSHVKAAVNMKQLLKKNITFNKESLNLNKKQPDFVRISFKMNKDGTIKVIDMNYSSLLIKDQLINQLRAIKFFGIVDVNETYNYNFSFKKK